MFVIKIIWHAVKNILLLGKTFLGRAKSVLGFVRLRPFWLNKAVGSLQLFSLMYFAHTQKETIKPALQIFSDLRATAFNAKNGHYTPYLIRKMPIFAKI